MIPGNQLIREGLVRTLVPSPNRVTNVRKSGNIWCPSERDLNQTNSWNQIITEVWLLLNAILEALRNTGKLVSCYLKFYSHFRHPNNQNWTIEWCQGIHKRVQETFFPINPWRRIKRMVVNDSKSYWYWKLSNFRSLYISFLWNYYSTLNACYNTNIIKQSASSFLSDCCAKLSQMDQSAGENQIMDHWFGRWKYTCNDIP